jgi:ketosteroid isomerase-like protein
MGSSFPDVPYTMRAGQNGTGNDCWRFRRCLDRSTDEEMKLTTTDHDAIRRICGQYCHYLDGTGGEQIIDSLLALFTDDGSLYSPRQATFYQGRERLREFFEGAYSGTMGKSKHLTANTVIGITGDSATAVSDWIYLRQGTKDGPDALSLAAYGRFHDEFIRADGEWRIHSRRISRGNDASVASNAP